MTAHRLFTRRHSAIVAVLWLLPLTQAGCSLSSNRSQELVEARLRQQDDTIRELERRLQSSNETVAALQQEADTIRLASQQGMQPIPPEQADSTFRVAKLEVSSLMSGGIDRDQSPGDDQFTLLLTPRDATGNTLRAVGNLDIELLDFTRPSEQQRIGQWQFSRADVGTMWHQGLVGQGYQFTSPWQQLPSSPDVHVHARLTTVDGRQFDATSKLRVTPPSNPEPSTFEPPKSIRPVSAEKPVPLGWSKSTPSKEPRTLPTFDDDGPLALPEP